MLCFSMIKYAGLLKDQFNTNIGLLINSEELTQVRLLLITSFDY